MNERLKHLLKAVKGSDGQQNGKTTKNRRKRINLSELTNFLDWNERREDTKKRADRKYYQIKSFLLCQSKKSSILSFSQRKQANIFINEKCTIENFRSAEKKIVCEAGKSRENLLPTRALSVRLLEMV